MNPDGIEVSLFCSECALFEYVIKHEYVLPTSDSFWHVRSHLVSFDGVITDSSCSKLLMSVSDDRWWSNMAVTLTSRTRIVSHMSSVNTRRATSFSWSVFNLSVYTRVLNIFRY